MPALAQEQAAAFEYYPVAHHMPSGQFQAEVWRRNLRIGPSDLAWSNQERYATAARAMAEACVSIQQNFDTSFSCSRVANATPASSSTAPSASVTAPAKRTAVPAVEPKVTSVNAPVRSRSVTYEPVGLDEKSSWLKDFWKNIEKHSGGGGGGDGGSQ
jgi:hypothetical protein